MILVADFNAEVALHAAASLPCFAHEPSRSGVALCSQADVGVRHPERRTNGCFGRVAADPGHLWWAWLRRALSVVCIDRRCDPVADRLLHRPARGRRWWTPEVVRPLVVLRALFGELAQPLQRAAQQPRNLHLRDADSVGDLGLREILAEAQVEDLTLAAWQMASGREDRRVLIDQSEPLVLGSDRIEAARLLVLLAGERRVKRHGAVCLGRL